MKNKTRFGDFEFEELILMYDALKTSGYNNTFIAVELEQEMKKRNIVIEEDV